MPGTAFGFPSYATQRPSVSPQQVGQMLVQRQQPQGPPMDMGMPQPMTQQALNGDVGRLLSDSGMDDTPIGGSPHLPSAVNIAAQNATARGPAVMQGSQPNAPSPLSIMQLRQMGVSEAEIQLLRVGGGIK